MAEGRLAGLIADLGSPRFADREAAESALEELGDQAAPALRRALEGRPGLEARRRIERLLDGLKDGSSPTALRRSRAVQAMELAATAEAREVLRAWAAGAPEARLTREARAGLRRLSLPR